jgi:hypothetical protein
MTCRSRLNIGEGEIVATTGEQQMAIDERGIARVW